MACSVRGWAAPDATSITVCDTGGAVPVEGSGMTSRLQQVPEPQVVLEDLSRIAAGRPSRPARTWMRGYSRVLVVLEAVAAAVAGGSVLFSRPGGVDVWTSLFWGAAGLVVMWPALLLAVGAHDERVFGTGSDEYRLVGRAGLLALALAGFVSYAAGLDLSRALVVVAVPALTLATLVLRYGARMHLHRQRVRGRTAKRVAVERSWSWSTVSVGRSTPVSTSWPPA